MRILGKILLGLLALILTAVIGVAAYVYLAIDDSYPQVEGEIQISGLQGQVDVYRDQAGVPHIYASTEHDLFFAQGYIHAQDRFWQMDFNRHVGSGRLSEMLGSATLDTDLFLRTVGWERVARQELELMDEQTIGMLEAYAAGVNAYLAERDGTELSLEYLFLGLLNSSYEPAPWEPINTLTWAKAMAWDLRDNMDAEIERAILLATMPEVRINDLFPEYKEDERPIIVPDFEPPSIQVQTNPTENYFAASEDTFTQLSSIVSKVDDLLGGDPAAELGSNSWVVNGELSATGAPLMANDPHLSTGIPSLWYQVGLHCAPKGPDCSYETVGVSFVGAPGVVIGHNESIAWGLTNVGADVMDLYVVLTNPDDPYQYEKDGRWIDMGIVTEEVVVAGGETIDLPVRLTEYGPIISDVYGDLENFDEVSGLNLPENYAVALRWTALDPGRTFQSIFNINRSQNFDEFRAAASEFVVPSQNLLYADVEGNIGYQMPGSVPVRTNGDGRIPAPGWMTGFEWAGFIPFDHLPYSFNPESGYIVAANNAIVTEEYPYHIADTWDYGYRAQRIVDLLMAAEGPIDIEYYKQMQADSVNLGALAVIPQLAGIEFEDEEVAGLRDQLLAWDGEQSVDSSMAALFNTYWMELLVAGFHDELPEAYWPGGNSSWYDTVSNIEADNIFWDSAGTEETETRDDIIAAAFNSAVAKLKATNSDPTKWAWGDLHHKTFTHETMDSFPIIGGLFNRGPFPVSGGSAIVNATNWDAASGSFAVTSLPSKRTIYDLGNWQNSLQMNTTGQSGHAYHEHYIDLAEMWASVQYNPMHWDRAVIEGAAEAHLVLSPAE